MNSLEDINIKFQYVEGVSHPDHFDNIVNLQSWLSEYDTQVDPDSQIARQLFDILDKVKRLYKDFLDRDVVYIKEVLNTEKKRAIASAVGKAKGGCSGRCKKARSKKRSFK